MVLPRSNFPGSCIPWIHRINLIAVVFPWAHGFSRCNRGHSWSFWSRVIPKWSRIYTESGYTLSSSRNNQTMCWRALCVEKIGLFCCPTLCRSRRSGTNCGSYSSCSESMLTGDWRLPLLHKLHSGLTKPQKSGPETIWEFENLYHFINLSPGLYYLKCLNAWPLFH